MTAIFGPRRLVRPLLLAIFTLTLAACSGGGSGGSASNNVSVPSVVGNTQSAASTAITAAGLTVGTVTNQSSASVTSGNVISESPAAGTSVSRGSPVALVVSTGPAPTTVAVPDVVGNTQSAATTAITGAGLTVGTVTTQSSATVASGNVISETPTAGTSVATGSSVALVVSSGPAPTQVAVPNVVGSTQASASNAITSAGLVLGTITSQSSSTVATGNVISENPAAGTSVASGSAVALVVSTGPSATTYTVGGVVIGLGAGHTVHVLNGSDNVPVSGNASFTFPTAIASGSTYAVTVGTPQPAGQTCAVQSGTGTASSANITNVVVYCTTSQTAAALTGAYTVLTDDLILKANAVENLTFDGAGGYTGSAIRNVNTVISNASVSGSFTLVQDQSTAQIPLLTLNGSDYGALQANGSALVVLSNASGGTAANLFVGVKQAQNASVSTLNGSWLSISLESTGTPSSTVSTFTANNGTGSFPGGQRNTNGVISTPPGGGTGSYTVTSNGAVTLGTGGAGISGAVSADGNLLVLAPTTSNGNGATPGIYVAVKQGTGVTAATLNGAYTFVSLSPKNGVITGRYYAVGMGNGAFAGGYAENISGTGTTGHTVTGTVTTAGDGTLTVALTDANGTIHLTGATSPDGNVLALSDLTSGEPTLVLVGVRQ